MSVRSLWAVLGLSFVLGACSAATIEDRLPAGMGLPEGTPARPETPYAFPAVHDMPPDRATVPMSQDEQAKLENDLAKVRDRQEGRPAGKTPANPAKKLRKSSGKAQSDGAKANP